MQIASVQHKFVIVQGQKESSPLIRSLTALERQKLVVDGDKLSRLNTTTAYNTQLKKFEVNCSRV